MRSKKALINTFTAILCEIVTIICSFILPRLILSSFGSSYNGITSSITQFISCIVLLRAGVGGVTRAALYKPLADKNTNELSQIIKATEIFMKKVSLLFAAFLVVFAAIYPVFVNSEFDWIFSFSLVLILGISTFAQNYFGITYQILLQADQKKYVLSWLTIVTTILNTIVASVLILAGASIHIVKLGSAIVFTLNPLFLNYYVKKSYHLDVLATPNNAAISQRWDAFAQQVAAFVNNNTDIMVLTVFCNLKEISVYTVYHMVANGLYKIENTVCDGIEAAFGNMLAKDEEQLLHKNFRMFELLVFSTSTFLFVCGGLLIVPFVMVYTKGITDVSYSRPVFGALMCINQFLFCIRLPYHMLTDAAGEFKRTRNGAIFESFMNVVISVVLVFKFGLIGVTVGTFCALFFRTMQYSVFASKNILKRSMKVVIKRIIISVMEAGSVVAIVHYLPVVETVSYLTWLLEAIKVGCVSLGIILVYSVVFFNDELRNLVEKIGSLLVKAKKKKQ